MAERKKFTIDDLTEGEDPGSYTDYQIDENPVPSNLIPSIPPLTKSLYDDGVEISHRDDGKWCIVYGKEDPKDATRFTSRPTKKSPVALPMTHFKRFKEVQSTRTPTRFAGFFVSC